MYVSMDDRKVNGLANDIVGAGIARPRYVFALDCGEYEKNAAGRAVLAPTYYRL